MSLRRILALSLLAGLILGWAGAAFGFDGRPIGMAAAFASVMVLGMLTPPKRPKSRP